MFRSDDHRQGAYCLYVGNSIRVCVQCTVQSNSLTYLIQLGSVIFTVLPCILLLSILLFIQLNAQLNCSKGVLKFTLKFTLKALLHVSV
jgi:hypothetical protein